MPDKKLRFEWDPNKAQANERKHGISFDLAKLVFLDPLAQTELDGTDHGEERWRTTGDVAKTLFVVSHTYREEENGEIIRVISARKATKRERERFERYSQT